MAELPTFTSAVRVDCTVTARSLTDQVQARDGISLLKKRRTLYQTREQVRDVSVEELAQPYDKIPGYLATL